MVDRRILPDLRWIADTSRSTSPTATRGRCRAVGTAAATAATPATPTTTTGWRSIWCPRGGGTKCDKSWLPITRLALWAEPVQNQPRPPFRWVGYNGDTGHGCGDHSPPLLEPRPGTRVPARRMGRSLSFQRHRRDHPPPATQPPPSTQPPSEPAPEPKPKKGPTGSISQVPDRRRLDRGATSLGMKRPMRRASILHGPDQPSSSRASGCGSADDETPGRLPGTARAPI